MRYVVLAYLILGAFSVTFAVNIESTDRFGPVKANVELKILSSTDIEVFKPVLEAFANENRDISMEYITASTAEIYEAVRNNTDDYDLIMSSAMDLQMKLANDGFAQSVSLPENALSPNWSKWQNKLFGFSLEPIGMVLSKSYFKDTQIPNRRRDLISFLRANQKKLKGRIGTYDVKISGAGFLFATQDARQSDSFWRLAEVMGGLNTTLFCCSGQMLDKVNNEEILLAYNIIGSYAEKRAREGSNLEVVYFQDYTHMLLRSALIPKNAKNVKKAIEFLAFILGSRGQNFIEKRTGMLSLNSSTLDARGNFRPIRLDLGLLVYLDKLKKKRFLDEWGQALIQ